MGPNPDPDEKPIHLDQKAEAGAAKCNHGCNGPAGGMGWPPCGVNLTRVWANIQEYGRLVPKIPKKKIERVSAISENRDMSHLVSCRMYSARVMYHLASCAYQEHYSNL